MNALVNWQEIDTVLLDMDGTLLDLHFDNHFWLEFLPERYADAQSIPLDQAKQQLEALIRAHEGTLNWYCLDYWSNALDMDIPAMKREIQHKIAIRPHVERFLQQVRAANKCAVLITNAHRGSLDLKLEVTQIDRCLDVIISSHDYGEPKEADGFWQVLQQRHPFDPNRTLFVDDTLRVLDAAKTYGIKHLLCVHQPDSQIPRSIKEYPAVHHFDELMPVTFSS